LWIVCGEARYDMQGASGRQAVLIALFTCRETVARWSWAKSSVYRNVLLTKPISVQLQLVTHEVATSSSDARVQLKDANQTTHACITTESGRLGCLETRVLTSRDRMFTWPQYRPWTSESWMHNAHKRVCMDKTLSYSWQTARRVCTSMLRFPRYKTLRSTVSMLCCQELPCGEWLLLLAGFCDYGLSLTHLTSSMSGIPSSYRVHILCGKTRMAGLQSGEGRRMIDSVVWTQYINVTDTHRQPRCYSNVSQRSMHRTAKS